MAHFTDSEKQEMKKNVLLLAQDHQKHCDGTKCDVSIITCSNFYDVPESKQHKKNLLNLHKLKRKESQ